MKNAIQVNDAKKRKTWVHFRASLPLLLMTLPGFVYLIINNYLPMIGLTVAFQDYDKSKGIFRSEFIGLKNFEYLFKTSDAWIITRNTVLYNIVFIVITTIVAIAVAIMLNEITQKYFVRFYQSAILLPYLISMVMVSYLVFALLSSDTGFINNTIFPIFGIDPITWYSSPQFWPYIIVIVNTWKNIGFACVLYYAAIVAIDKSYYEAAMIDGANKWQQITKITIPLISPVIIIVVLLSIGKIFYSDFGLFYQVPMNSGALFNTTNVVNTYVYRALMELGDVGMSSAAGFYQSIVGFVLVVISNAIVKKRDPQSALF